MIFSFFNCRLQSNRNQYQFFQKKKNAVLRSGKGDLTQIIANRDMRIFSPERQIKSQIYHPLSKTPKLISPQVKNSWDLIVNNLNLIVNYYSLKI